MSLRFDSALNRIVRGLCGVAFVLGSACPVEAQTWTDTSLSAQQRADALVSALSLDEKIALVHGTGGSYVGNIPANSRVGIPAMGFEDGPAGIGQNVVNVTAFPAPITLAASWDVELARQYGSALGAESHGKGVSVQLAPMMNLARVYQSGRNFEGSGEDPHLTAAMAAAEIQGIQSQGVIACAKHFVCNEQETNRGQGSSDVDERTLHEIYYPPFLASVEAGVGTFMAAYNRLNARFACESEVINAVLKKQWGFAGIVMSDWNAGFSTVAGANNGLDLEMPVGDRFGDTLKSDVQAGVVPEADLNGMARRILVTMFQFGLYDHAATGNLGSNVMSAAHEQLAQDVAAQGTVLLKNRGGLLPLNPAAIDSIAVVGTSGSIEPISIGGGSATVVMPYYVTPLFGMSSRVGAGVTVNYNQGDNGHISEAAQLAATSDVAIVCVGERTSENWDRGTLSLPGDQDALVNAVAAANTNTIVVLYASASTLMPWASNVAAVLVAWYPGQENGRALAAVLCGDVNPSAKLPMTFPSSGAQIPASTTAQFPGVKGRSAYSEGLLMGYRWYDANDVTPLFPFGYGLSYTTFGYSNLVVGAVSTSGQVQISFDLTNTGSRAGAEVAQLYLGFPAAAGEPPKQLKAFQKVTLSAGQGQHVTFNLDWHDLANWDGAARGWIVTPGTFQAMVGGSSRDISLTGSFTVASSIPSSDLANAALHQLATNSSVLATNYPAIAAVDGNTATAWASLASDPQWIRVDLGLTKDLSRVRLLWNTNYARSYVIQVSSNGTAWTDIYSSTNGGGGTEDLLVSGRGRYLRMYGTAQATGSGYSLLEFQAYSQPQRPFGGTIRNLPGRVQAEDYDTGGEGVAYYDTATANAGGAYRSDDVGVETNSDIDSGYDVGWIVPGEWLEYTVHAPDPSAIYNIHARVAGNDVGQMRVRLDGTVLGTVQIPNTGGWQSWQTITVSNVHVAGGANSRALRLEMLTANFNVNWIEFDRLEIGDTNNIALSRSVSCSSVENGSYVATNAIDGDLITRWASAYSDPQWIRVDLGATQDIAHVRLIWENAFARSFTIQLSPDDSTWTTAYMTTNGPGGLQDVGALGHARYVRMHSTQRATGYGNSLWEFEIYSALTPSLAITPNGGNIILRWPVSTATWDLESIRALAATNQWEAVAAEPAIVNSENFITNDITANALFYRLRPGP